MLKRRTRDGKPASPDKLYERQARLPIDDNIRHTLS